VANNENYKPFAALAISVALAGCAAEEESDPAASYTIEQIAGNLYKASTVTHRTVLVVTDPINRDFSAWLRNQIEERFGVPVRYVLYTHHHWDHASGGAVFDDTATFIGHENMISQLALPAAGSGFPADAARMDADGNGRLSMEEAQGAYAANFALFDYDGDGSLSGAEATRGPLNEVRVPDLTFSDEAEVTLGGTTVRSVYVGNHTHTDDMSIIVFPEENVGFMADFISIVRPPRWIRGEQPIESWIAAIRVVEAQGFDVAVGGHGDHAGAEYVTYFREYLEELRDRVSAGIDSGQTVADLQESIYMNEYADWISYDEFREQNIEDMYNLLTQEF
jgi:glyoxylase-like metal-dependent hydrolase (beta-lactamase superfamily II)